MFLDADSPTGLARCFVLPMSYQSPRSLQDKWGGRPAARTPIHHHLMCIKARSPLIAKTNKKSRIDHRQQQAGGGRGAAGCSAPLFPSLSTLGQRPRSWGQAPAYRGQVTRAGQLSPLHPRPKSCPGQMRKLRHRGICGRQVSHKEDWAALAGPVPTAGTVWTLEVQGSGTPVQGATSFARSSQPRKVAWARTPSPGTWCPRVRGPGPGPVVLEPRGTLGLGQMFAGPVEGVPGHRNLDIPA